MLAQPQCFKRKCVHFQGVQGDDEQSEVCVCAAFPKGIPVEISYGTNKHTEPYPGDNGIQYEKVK